MSTAKKNVPNQWRPRRRNLLAAAAAGLAGAAIAKVAKVAKIVPSKPQAAAPPAPSQTHERGNARQRSGKPPIWLGHL